ncbi:potassium-transporting ATPase subunit KdpC [Rhodoferax sp. U11-2br]|uniref:potassium-transporting ATPase subunit KdpC n=1 Tax=Rhodoferax sp. U11-2br TaxID=2838878 RepID=UPI001BE8EF97|nr:potassium-transporting ATPase subunit KdpC [Rhodoferax sp. U11-2br]MBT3065305.1 potassium-transporting ATPase subunit KdpC [Rhodoferax sp. U11-2br]
MKNILRPALVLFVALSLLTGIAYPLLVTGLAKNLFPAQAHGSLILRDGQVVGSTLIGQHFTTPAYFWGRPSATSPMANNAAASGGSNLGPMNPALVDAVKARVAALRAADPTNTAAVPVDLVTASASGLDPHISPAAAQYQLDRVAKARQLPTQVVQGLIDQATQRPLLGLLGEPVVNVLQLNVALDAHSGHAPLN